MNKSFYLLLALACCGFGSMQAEQISEAQAIALARQFTGNTAKTQSLGSQAQQLRVAYTEVSKKPIPISSMLLTMATTQDM